jgi:hypothetical protein
MSDSSSSAAAEVPRVPFAPTQRVRAESALRRLPTAGSGSQRTWTFDLAINRHQLGGGDPVAINDRAAPGRTPEPVTGRLGLWRRL